MAKSEVLKMSPKTAAEDNDIAMRLKILELAVMVAQGRGEAPHEVIARALDFEGYIRNERNK